MNTQSRKDHLFGLGVSLLDLEVYLTLKIRRLEILLLISSLPLFALLLDGFYQKKLKKGFQLILLFVAIVITAFILLRTLGLTFALGMPVILFGILAISSHEKRRQNAKSDTFER